ncbi:MAG: hypothetical protein ACO1QB_03490 [Verrucomicrobiales bacterium]
MKIVLAILLSVLLGYPSSSYALVLPETKTDNCQSCPCCIKQNARGEPSTPAALPSAPSTGSEALLQFLTSAPDRWLMLPASFKATSPARDHLPPSSVPLFQRICLRLI